MTLRLALAALTLSACAAGRGDLEIRSQVAGEPVVLRTAAVFAGAVSSLQFRGVEYIDIHDHGRQMQSAVSFDGVGECFNPTEAGRRGDRGRSTSRLLDARAGADWLETETDMAFWLEPGGKPDDPCGPRPDVKSAVNLADRDGYLLRKKVSFVREIPGLIAYEAEFVVPRAHRIGTFEIMTGYMPARFSRPWLYDIRTGALRPTTRAQGEQRLPVILATEDGAHAMGVWSPHLPQNSLGYGHFAFPPSYRVVKWNCVYRVPDVPPGAYGFRCYTAFGTLEEVKAALTAAAARFGATAPTLPAK